MTRPGDFRPTAWKRSTPPEPPPCPECGGVLQRTRMGVAPAGSHESEAKEVGVLACTACEHVEEEVTE